MRKPRAKAPAATGTDVSAARSGNEIAAHHSDTKKAETKSRNVLPVAGVAEASPDTSTLKATAAIAVVENANVEMVDSADWPGVDLSFLKPAVVPAPALPISQLPPSFSDLVTRFVEARKLVPDYVAFALLSAVSGAIGNRVRVGLPDGTTETLSTYTILVGDASTGKGRALNVVEEPLRLIDAELSGGGGGAAMAAGQVAFSKVLEQIQAKVSGRLAVDYEQLATIATESTGASLLVTEATGPGLLDELGTDQCGRMLLTHEITGALGYLISSQASRSQSILLTAFDGGPYTGRSKTGGRIRIPALVLTVLGATQPRKLLALLRGADDGFAARIFWIFPNATATAALGDEPGPVGPLRDILSRLISIKSPNAGPSYSAVIPLGAGARELVETASAVWLRRQVLSDDLFGTVLGRARQYAIRIGGLFEILGHVVAGKRGLPVAVGPDAMASAIALVDLYILPMAARAFTTIPPKDSNAVALAKHMASAGKPEINAREDIVRGGSPLRKPLEVREALEELRQRGLVRPAPQAGGRGRPSGDWEVHPALLALGRL